MSTAVELTTGSDSPTETIKIVEEVRTDEQGRRIKVLHIDGHTYLSRLPGRSAFA